MDQIREDYGDEGGRSFRLPPAWVLFLLALFAIGLAVVVADLVAIADLKKP